MLLALALVAGQTPKLQTVSVDGQPRSFICVPSNEVRAAPVVFAFHGHGGNSRNAYRSFHIHDYLPEATVIYPQGLPTRGMTDPQGKLNGWQQKPGDEGDRDVKFFDKLLSDLRKAGRVDEDRIYVMGHSNGGRFTYVLWSRRGDQIAALAPSGSPGMALLRRAPKRSAFLIAGREDKIVPFFGQNATAAYLQRLLGTGSDGRTHGLATSYSSSDGFELVTYFHPGGHEYPADAPKMIADFFRRHRRPVAH